MFSKIVFFFDENGMKMEEPREIEASQVNSSCFYLGTYPFRMMRLPDTTCLHILRNYKNIEDDPYNENGCPPTLMTVIVMPQMTFVRGGLEIFGFEYPNICHAGLMISPYFECKPPRVEKKLLRDDFERSRELSTIPKQHIVLRI